MEVLSTNGLNIKVDVTVRVNPEYGKIGDLHERFGRDYLNTLVRPEVRSAVRKIIGRFEPEELYSSKRDEVQKLIQEDLKASLAENHIVLQAINMSYSKSNKKQNELLLLPKRKQKPMLF